MRPTKSIVSLRSRIDNNIKHQLTTLSYGGKTYFCRLIYTLTLPEVTTSEAKMLTNDVYIRNNFVGVIYENIFYYKNKP
jgi:hypothetical protein